MVWAHVMFNLETMPNIGVAAFLTSLALFQNLPRKEIRFVSVSQDAETDVVKRVKRKTWASVASERFTVADTVPKVIADGDRRCCPPRILKKSGSVLFRSPYPYNSIDACLIPLTQNRRKPTITLGRTLIAQR